jgi:hypothetical protein
MKALVTIVSCVVVDSLLENIEVISDVKVDVVLNRTIVDFSVCSVMIRIIIFVPVVKYVSAVDNDVIICSWFSSWV